jgi:hypothetical protein
MAKVTSVPAATLGTHLMLSVLASWAAKLTSGAAEICLPGRMVT